MLGCCRCRYCFRSIGAGNAGLLLDLDVLAAVAVAQAASAPAVTAGIFLDLDVSVAVVVAQPASAPAVISTTHATHQEPSAPISPEPSYSDLPAATLAMTSSGKSATAAP